MDALRKRRPSGRRTTVALCRIRRVEPRDIAAIHGIERAIFADPWSSAELAGCAGSGVPFFVSEVEGVVVGYVIARYAADEGEILNLGVAPGVRRRGIARGLVDHMLGELARWDVQTVYLEVRESNAAARRLYETFGFREVGRRARYYRRPVEDAVVLRTAISTGRGVA